MDDIDKRLNEILNDMFLDIYNIKETIEAIKQLMADDFEKRLNKISKDFRPELIDMSNKDYHPDIAPGFSIGFNLAKNLIIERAKYLEKWKKQ